MLVATLNVDELDPGIRDIVILLRANGFDTTDSGDGVSKPANWYESGCAMPVPNVAATVRHWEMIEEAERMVAILGDGWTVQASYSTHDKSCILLATKDAIPT